jgi:cytochrome c nitrite reductase small subunit
MRVGLTLLIAVLIGTAIGLGGYTFVYAKGYSYLQNDPSACANCHVMQEHFRAWNRSRHRAVAGCNDCHTPHDPIGKYSVKAQNGFWHSFYFTTGRYPYPIRITPPNHDVVERACRDCHERITEAIEHGMPPRAAGAANREALSCVHCHRHVGHWLR